MVGAASASSGHVHLAGVLPEDAHLAAAVRQAAESVPAVQIDWVADRAEADTRLARQEVAGALEVTDTGGQSVVELRLDRGRVDPGLVSGPMLALVSDLARRTDGPRLAVELFGVQGDPIAPERDPVRASSEVLDTGAARPIGGFTFAAVGNLVLYSFVATFGTAVALMHERNDGQLERLLAAPVPRSAIVGGHLLARLAIGGIQIAFVVAVTSALFGVQWGSLGLLALLSLPFVVTAGCAGLVAATWYRSNQQASLLTGLVAFPAAMLAGCFWPLAIVSAPLRLVGHLLPQAWLVDALLEVSGGAGFGDVAGELAVLASVALVLLPFTLWTVSAFLVHPPHRSPT